MTNPPPKLATRLLHFFLRDELKEEVTGDLEEKFVWNAKNKSVFKAKLNYWFQVFNYLRPFAIRNAKPYLNPYPMYKSYVKVGWRNLLKSKAYSFINIGGLSIGLAVAILIGLWIVDELSYNKNFKNYDRIVQVLQHQYFNGHTGTQTAIPIPLEAQLRKDYGDDFKYLALTSWNGDHILSHDSVKLSQSGNYVGAEQPRILSLDMVEGSIDGLKELSSILLSQSTAKALFGDADPLNRMLRIDNRLDVKVTGVYKDFPFTCAFNDWHFLASWELYVSSEPWVKDARDHAQWDNNSFQLFAELAPNANADAVSNQIRNVKFDHIDVGDRVSKPEIFVYPMKDWHLRWSWDEGKQSGGMILYVRLFAIVGIFVLLLACINFINLSTARSAQRSKEVGIRKSIGSRQGQLVKQFLSESFIVVVISWVIALLLVAVAMPWFNDLAGKHMQMPFTEPLFWMASLGFMIVTGFLAGSYPALYLSAFDPVSVLKGTFRTGRFAGLSRRILVVLQFTVSVSLIIGTIVVYQQVQYTKDRPIGYDNDAMMMIQMTSPDYEGKYEILRKELKDAGAIEEMSESSSPLTGVWSDNGGFDWEGKDPNLQADFGTIWVTPDFGKTINWQVVQGRDFSRDFATDSTAIVMNETATKFMGISNPVGMTVKWGDNGTYHVIGVVKDLLMDSPFSPVRQTFFFESGRDFNWIELKLSPDKSMSEDIAGIRKVFQDVLPDIPFTYQFADEEHAKKFESEVRIGKLAGIFSILAVFISCLGLFGLASFVAERRTKEIGIRKVLGASIVSLWRMLSKDFVILVLVSNLVAIPITYKVLSGWLSAYQYRTHIYWWVFVVAAAVVVLITILTVSFQAIRAATMNPVKSLRSE